jgi:arginine decarboxylase-like protein
MSSQPKKQAAPAEWSIADAVELYRIASWGEPFFFVNEAGHVGIRALDEHGTTMDMVKIVSELRRRGVQFPMLIRFQDCARKCGASTRLSVARSRRPITATSTGASTPSR